jgi:hypothetical protein
MMEQYDLQLAEANRDVCLFASPRTGEPVSTSFLMPRSRDDLAKRRRHFKLRADHNFGLMGRAPDFINAHVTGWGFAGPGAPVPLPAAGPVAPAPPRPAGLAGNYPADSHPAAGPRQ